MLPVEIVPVQETLVLRARGSELLILPHHIKHLKGCEKPKDFSEYFRSEALVNRPARKLFEAWLRKDESLWKRLYICIHKEMELKPDGEDAPAEKAPKVVAKAPKTEAKATAPVAKESKPVKEAAKPAAKEKKEVKAEAKPKAEVKPKAEAKPAAKEKKETKPKAEEKPAKKAAAKKVTKAKPAADKPAAKKKTKSAPAGTAKKKKG